MGRPKGSTNKKITTKEEAIKKEMQRLYMAKWKEKKKLKEAVWTESYQTQIKEPVLLDEAVSVPQGPQRDEKGKFLPGHKATRNVRNPFKKMLDSISPRMMHASLPVKALVPALVKLVPTTLTQQPCWSCLCFADLL